MRDWIPHQDVPALLKALDLIVMLPERAPFSSAVLEAMAKPGILSRTLGNIECEFYEYGKSLFRKLQAR